MRTVIVALLLFTIFHFIRLDIVEGTIPLASFAKTSMPCEEPQAYETIRVRTIEGDTIETLFAMYSMMNIRFMDRLALFYELNPHLQNQAIIGNLEVILPIDHKIAINSCQDET